MSFEEFKCDMFDLSTSEKFQNGARTFEESFDNITVINKLFWCIRE